MYSCVDTFLDTKTCTSKRVSRACDRCRLKKTKCDGRRCCNRCLADDAICIFSKRKRSSDRPYSPEYVQLLEDQQMKLVEGVQELYRRLRRGEGWTGPRIAEDSQGCPLVQDVLDSLAVLAPSERKKLKRKADDASLAERDDDNDDDDDDDNDDDEDEEQYHPCDGSAPIDQASPPLTPPASQPSASSSPIDDGPGSRSSITYTPSQFQRLMSKPVPEEQINRQSDQLLQDHALMAGCSEYWSIPPLYSGLEGTADLNGLMDPFLSTQATCAWYPDTYIMMI